MNPLTENEMQLAKKLADAGPNEDEAIKWVAEIVAEAGARALLEAADGLDRRWYEKEAEKEAEMNDYPDATLWLEGHASAEEWLRARAADLRDGGEVFLF